VIAFVVGSILGGYFISWLKLRRALFPLVCIFNVPFVVYARWRGSSLRVPC